MKRPVRESGTEKGMWYEDGNERPLNALRSARRAVILP